LAVAGPMDVFMTLAHPFLGLMNGSANLVLRGFGMHLRREGGAHSSEELKLMVTASCRVGLLPEAEEAMIHHALELGNLTVREIMVPRNKIFSLSADMPLEEAMAKVWKNSTRACPFTIGKGKENIIGLLVTPRTSPGDAHAPGRRVDPGAEAIKIKVRHIMREVLFVPEPRPHLICCWISKAQTPLAVVVDEFGLPSAV